MVAKFLDHNNRKLKQRRRRRQREQLKRNKLMLAKQQLCTCITLFCTFLSRRCTTATWNLPIFTRLFHGVGKPNTTIFFIIILNLNTFVSDSTPEIKWNWIRLMKFEKLGIHFWSKFSVCCHPEIFATMETWRNDFSSLLTIHPTQFPSRRKSI